MHYIYACGNRSITWIFLNYVNSPKWIMVHKKGIKHTVGCTCLCLKNSYLRLNSQSIVVSSSMNTITFVLQDYNCLYTEKISQLDFINILYILLWISQLSLKLETKSPIRIFFRWILHVSLFHIALIVGQVPLFWAEKPFPWSECSCVPCAVWVLVWAPLHPPNARRP